MFYCKISTREYLKASMKTWACLFSLKTLSTILRWVGSELRSICRLVEANLVGGRNEKVRNDSFYTFTVSGISGHWLLVCIQLALYRWLSRALVVPSICHQLRWPIGCSSLFLELNLRRRLWFCLKSPPHLVFLLHPMVAEPPSIAIRSCCDRLLLWIELKFPSLVKVERAC